MTEILKLRPNQEMYFYCHYIIILFLFNILKYIPALLCLLLDDCLKYTAEVIFKWNILLRERKLQDCLIIIIIVMTYCGILRIINF